VPHATRDAASIIKLSTTGLSPPLVQHSTASSSRLSPYRCPTTPECMHSGLGCFRFARRYLGNHVCFLFLQLLRCFNSLSSLFPPYGFRWQYIGLPHSETSGSMLASNSPEHIVGNHVLLRLCVPRYPPSALLSLTTYCVNTIQLSTLVSVIFVSDNLLVTLQFSRIGFLSSVSYFLPDKFLCSFHGSGWKSPAGSLV
jgi:hypothetical protein